MRRGDWPDRSIPGLSKTCYPETGHIATEGDGTAPDAGQCTWAAAWPWRRWKLLVHLRVPEVLQAYRKLRVRIPVGLIQDVDVRDLPPGWAVPSLHPPTQEIGDRWLDSLQSAVLRVPSAVVAGEVNYILNPAHACACRIDAGRIEDFRYDSRVLKTF